VKVADQIRRRRAMAAGDDGMTLIELLIAVLILGLTGTAIIGMFIVMTSTTFLHKQQANVGAVLRSEAESVNTAPYVCTGTAANYSSALFSVPVSVASGSKTMTVGITPSPFNKGAVGDLVADSGGSGSPAIPAGTKITAVSANGSSVTLAAAATATATAGSGEAVMFYPTVVLAPTIATVTKLDGSPVQSTDCSATLQPLEIVAIQVQSVGQRVTQTLSVVKAPPLTSAVS
jgi:type II secretory pathway pseudopilin PulG